MYRIRSPISSYRASEGFVPDQKKIQFCHPGYSYPRNILIVLSALDRGPNRSPGLHFETAKIACGILAGNAFENTYFTEGTRDGPRLQGSSEDLLTSGRYYFHIEGNDHYAVVRDFLSWSFPHDDPPSYWESLLFPPRPLHQQTRYSDSRSVHERNLTYRVTGVSLTTEKAHLIRSTLSSWFDTNNMEIYNNEDGGANVSWIDKSSNIMLLRQDIHTLMDSDLLVIIPKARPSENTSIDGYPSLGLVLHALRPDHGGELFRLYHDRALLAVSGIAWQFLFVAFAEKIFNLAQFFKHDNIERLSRLWNSEEQTWTEKAVRLPPRSRSRSKHGSGSPPKKARHDGLPISHTSTVFLGYEEESRGRKRYRDSRSPSRSFQTQHSSVSARRSMTRLTSPDNLSAPPRSLSDHSTHVKRKRRTEERTYSESEIQSLMDRV